MNKGRSVSRTLEAITGAMALVLVVTSAILANGAYDEMRLARRIVTASGITRDLFTAMQYRRIEFGTVNTALVSPLPVDRETWRQIVQLRARSTAALDRARTPRAPVRAGHQRSPRRARRNGARSRARSRPGRSARRYGAHREHRTCRNRGDGGASYIAAGRRGGVIPARDTKKPRRLPARRAIPSPDRWESRRHTTEVRSFNKRFPPDPVPINDRFSLSSRFWRCGFSSASNRTAIWPSCTGVRLDHPPVYAALLETMLHGSRHAGQDVQVTSLALTTEVKRWVHPLC
jgi:hypothetical protein